MLIRKRAPRRKFWLLAVLMMLIPAMLYGFASIVHFFVFPFNEAQKWLIGITGVAFYAMFFLMFLQELQRQENPALSAGEQFVREKRHGYRTNAITMGAPLCLLGIVAGALHFLGDQQQKHAIALALAGAGAYFLWLIFVVFGRKG